MKPVKPGKLAEEADLKEDLADDVTRKRIRKHLSDKNDVITDEDIRNVKVPAKKNKRAKDAFKAEEEKNEDSNLTGWNILEE